MTSPFAAISVALLPCPFCGSDIIMPGMRCAMGSSTPTIHVVMCGSCGATAEMRHTEEAAIEAWNRRDPPRNSDPDHCPHGIPTGEFCGNCGHGG